MATTTLTRHRCARCNTRLRDGAYVYSRFTRARYCADVIGCSTRARKTRKGNT